ncbi:hypothetical protein M2444_004921 [Paenibacillus sp. PastF-3]|uniref:hypothetical protein n=1 Tax=unclassified Paenibacillus TaxID=185978 RepID=UPI002475D0DD|nr:hypothetical protein [Paenibacillus sp. PastF-3]MDH6373091.1 hypothetical protein [Paenibacillus sp. PastF-3]
MLSLLIKHEPLTEGNPLGRFFTGKDFPVMGGLVHTGIPGNDFAIQWNFLSWFDDHDLTNGDFGYSFPNSFPTFLTHTSDGDKSINQRMNTKFGLTRWKWR